MTVAAEYLAWVLLIFSIARVTVGIATKSARSWFSEAPTAGEVDRFRRERPNNLALAGFSLAALTIFLTIGSSPLDPTKRLEVRETAFFLSVALISFVIAASLFPFAINRYFSYAADSVEHLGLLTIGAGMLLFFINNFGNVVDLQIVYGIFFAVIISIATLEIYLYTKALKPAKNTTTQ